MFHLQYEQTPFIYFQFAHGFMESNSYSRNVYSSLITYDLDYKTPRF